MDLDIGLVYHQHQHKQHPCSSGCLYTYTARQVRVTWLCHGQEQLAFGPRSFSVAGPSVWNCLPPEIKTTSLTLGQFSGHQLKTETCFYVATTR